MDALEHKPFKVDAKQGDENHFRTNATRAHHIFRMPKCTNNNYDGCQETISEDICLSYEKRKIIPVGLSLIIVLLADRENL